MELLEKIELFYKMAQQLEAETAEVEAEENAPIKKASIKNRMNKLVALAKRSQTK